MLLTFHPPYHWQGFNRALEISNNCVLDAKENMAVPSSLLTYGSNMDAPEFPCDPPKGARVLLLAYAR